MKTSDNIVDLYAAFVKFQAEVDQPKKNATNPFYKNKYTTLDEIIRTVTPILGKHGLAVIQEVSSEGAVVSITTRIIHESGQWLETEPMLLKGEKETPQGLGSATSYGRRYALSAILGISSEDDDDGNNAEPSKSNEKEKPKQNNKPTTNNNLASDKQIELIKGLLKEKEYTVDSINAYIQKAFNKKGLDVIDKSEASEIITMLNDLKKK